MKKIVLSSVLALATVLISSCSEDNKEPINTAPTAPIVSISDHVANKSMTIVWSKSTDKEGSKVVYDLYANEKVIAEEQTTLKFTYDFSKQTATYPITFKVVVKDDKGATSTSKEELVKDPIIGKWKLVKFENQEITECDKKSTFTFFDDKTYSLRVYGHKIDNKNECTPKESVDAEWKKQKGAYFIQEKADIDNYNKVDFVFSNNKELNFKNKYLRKVE